MAGLLDSGLDPQVAMLMGLSSGLLGPRSREGFGAALGDGLSQGYNAYAGALSAADKRRMQQEELEMRRQEAAMREQEAQMRRAKFDAEMADAERARKSDELMRMAFKSNYDPGTRGGEVADYSGEFLTAPRNPSFNMPGFAGAMGEAAPMKAIELLQLLNQKKSPIKVGPGDTLVNPETLQAQYTAPFAPEKPPAEDAFVRRMRAEGIPEGSPEWQAALRQYRVSQSTPPPATNITVPVNTGQRGFGNERDLRKDYEGLPETKAFGELTGTISLIRTAAATPTPANDLALATKFMKLLDPGSVVRESELAMAMGATGLLDRVANYAEKVKSGVKLTPSQRTDFLSSANRIYAAAEEHQARIAQRARDGAARWEINPDAVAPVIVPGNRGVSKRLTWNPATGRLE